VSTAARPNDGERVGALGSGAERHREVARAPRRRRRDLDRYRPAATVRRRVLGSVVEHAVDLAAPEHLANGALAGDLDADATGVRRQMKEDRLARWDRRRVAVRLEGHRISAK
jgi:hypothetical protein